MKRFGTIDRYVLREVLGPLLLGLLVFTFILLMDRLFDAAELIIQRGVPGSLVFRFLALSLPQLIVLTIPMAFLFGILIAVGRLSADSELVALRAAGLSLFRLYRPILVLATLLALLTSFVYVFLMPYTNDAWWRLYTDIVQRTAAQSIKPGIFFEGLEGRTVFIFGESPTDDRWQGVFLSDDVLREDSKVTVADFGNVAIDRDRGAAFLQLWDSTEIETSLREPEKINLYTHERVEVVLSENMDLVVGSNVRSESKVLRSLTVRELLEWQGDAERNAMQRRGARVELHKRLAIPAACIVFGLFGVPLGFNARRGGRSSGFAISLLVILVYNLLLSNGEHAAIQGKMSPWLAVWMANIAFTLLGAFLLARKNRDKSLVLGRIDRLLRGNIWSRINARRRLRQRRRVQRRTDQIKRREISRSMRGSPDFLIRIPRLRLLFPNTFDRYILRQFTRVFVLVTLTGVVVYIIANFADLVDEVLRNDVGGRIVFDYYKYLTLQIFYQIAPIVVLLTTLITFGLLSRNSEITAAKALGMSLYRMAIPVVLAAVGVAAFCVLLDSSILPYSNARVAELNNEIRGIAEQRRIRRTDRNWLISRQPDSDYIIHYQYFNPRLGALQRAQVFRFDEHRELTGRLYAEQAYYRDDRWLVVNGWARSFGGTGDITFTPLTNQNIDLPEGPEFFDTEIKPPEELPYGELKRYITDLQSAGEEVPQLEVQLHSKVALPVVCLVMALVGLPFAFRLGRQGALYGIGLAIGLGMVFYAIMALFTTLGQAGALPPMVAVWIPNVLFATFSLYLFLGLRT